MDYKLFYFALFSFVLFVGCEKIDTSENETTATALNAFEGLFRKGRSQRSVFYFDLLSCAVRYDKACFVDVAQEYLTLKRNELLAQADLEVFRTTGRSDPENKPSYLAKSIEKLVSELSGLFRNGIVNFFIGKEEDEDDEVASSQDTNETVSRHDVGDKKGKKKKKKMLMKYCGIALAIVAKICLLFKLFHAGLQFKMFLIALANLLLHLAKFWLDVKKGYNPPKVIYHDHAQHHHDGDDWGRRSDAEREKAQNMAYSNQKPNEENYSYFT